MANLFYFSEYIIPIKDRVVFVCTVSLRFLKVLFKRRRAIQFVHLDFTRKYNFTSSYLIIRYQFLNAFWYNFKGVNKTTAQEVMIVNIRNLSVEPIELIVYGFFQKKSYLIQVKPENVLLNQSFKTAISSIRDISLNNKPVSVRNILIVPKDLQLAIKHPSIKLEFSPYTQTDFL